MNEHQCSEGLSFARIQRARKARNAVYRQIKRDHFIIQMEFLAAKYESAFHELYDRNVKCTYAGGWFICKSYQGTERFRRDDLEIETSWILAKVRVAVSYEEGLVDD